MPVVAKSTSNIAKLGALSTFDVSSSAIPHDTNDSAGGVPTFNATLVDGENTEFLIGETLTVTSPSVGSYSGEIVSVSKAEGSNRYNLSASSMLARLNSEIRLYPLSDYVGVDEPYLPLYALEYWTQQCGIFYSAVEGDTLFYQSQYGHFGAYAKGITRPIRSLRPAVSADRSVPILKDGRVVVTFGRDSQSVLNLPAPVVGEKSTGYLPVLVPAGATEKVVFGGDIIMEGLSRRGTITWNFKNGLGWPLGLRLEADCDNGFTLYTSDIANTFVSRIVIPVPNTAHYTFLIGLSTPTVGTTTFTLTILDANKAVVGTGSVTIGTHLRDSLMLTQVVYRGEDQGTSDPMCYSNIFISQMKTMPTTAGVTQKAFTPGYKPAQFLVGFNGNVWEHIKQYCSIYHLDVGYESGKLTVKQRQRDVTPGASLSELSTSVSARDQARNVEVVNQQHTPTGPTPTVLWAADSVYQVAVGEVQEFLIQTDHSILETRNPICVSGITPYPYKVGGGQYVVTGSDGYIVSPTFWADQGGLITADTTDNEGELKITIKGPDYDSPRAPYRISEGDAGRPALYISGLGVLAKPTTLKVGTGNRKAAKDIGTTLDSPFIGNVKDAYDAACRAARAFAVPEVKVSISEPIDYDGVSSMGTYPAGSLAKVNGNIVRVTDVSQTYSNFSGEAVQHNTIYQTSRSFEGATIAVTNAYKNGKTIGQNNIKPLKVVS